VRLGVGLRLARLRRRRTPAALIFFVTNACNLRCRHCFYWQHTGPRRDELTVADIGRLLRSFDRPLQYVVLTGGEAFLREDLPAICAEFCTCGTHDISIATNGFATDRTLAGVREIMRCAGIRLSVQVSLDGLAGTHDELRGMAGAFEHARATVRALADLRRSEGKPEVAVMTTISQRNQGEIEALAELVAQEPGISHRFQVVRGSSFSVFDMDPEALSDFEPEDDALRPPSPEDLEALLGTVRGKAPEPAESIGALTQVLKHEHTLAVMRHRKRTMTCRAGTFDGVVYPNGDVALCEFSRTVGNLRDCECDFPALWNSPEACAMRSKLRACSCTHACNILSSMMYDTASVCRLLDLHSNQRALGDRQGEAR
jgi:MoaA/NifB/PqqE/SkfB family radical SAM enzyme